jgi:hypothetical protein
LTLTLYQRLACMGNEGPCDAALGIVDAHGDYYLSLRPLFLG